MTFGGTVLNSVNCANFGCRSRPISKDKRESSQERFHNLLELSAKSSFAGERAAAFQAAERLAERHGLSMEEAARGGLAEQEPQQAPKRSSTEWAEQAERDLSMFVHLLDSEIEAQKAAREMARAEAVRRGLDVDECKSAARPARRGGAWVDLRPRKMEAHNHAKTLLRETSLPIQEVVDLTGLDIYEVVGMKLKARTA